MELGSVSYGRPTHRAVATRGPTRVGGLFCIVAGVLALVGAQPVRGQCAPAGAVLPYTASDMGIGQAVAVDGDRAVVGIGHDPDLPSWVTFWAHSGGAWVFDARVDDPGGELAGSFGLAVDIDVDTAVVGAPYSDDGSNTTAGIAYVFVREVSGQWALRDTLLPQYNWDSGEFGAAVAIDGDRLVIGAPVAGEDQAGEAHVYYRADGHWHYDRLLTSTAAPALARFGGAVAISGSFILVGASGDFGIQNPTRKTGAVYVFREDGFPWIQDAKLAPDSEVANGRFGSAVALHGYRALIGAPYQLPYGTAYVFQRQQGNWSQTHALSPSSGDVASFFGDAVALTDSTAVIGAPLDDNSGGENAGAVYVYRRVGITWEERAFIGGELSSAQDRFGSSVSLDGGKILVGAPSWGVGGDGYANAYHYTLNCLPSPGDKNDDGDIDFDDFQDLEDCDGGPGGGRGLGCEVFDFDSDTDVDLADIAGFQQAFTGEN